MTALIIIFALLAIEVIVCGASILYYVKVTTNCIENPEPIYYFKNTKGNYIINAEEVKTILKDFNRDNHTYEIIITLKDDTEIIESFEDEIEMNDRFDKLYYTILNDIIH